MNFWVGGLMEILDGWCAQRGQLGSFTSLTLHPPPYLALHISSLWLFLGSILSFMTKEKV